ncbi:histidinol-phosphate transaminase [Lentibacillus sp. N15]|uniref:histidinol-phosphate transaminase n=1 Tax=Lentibacillus songyuanensis TaxID=3136161 RepID=UPI0031BAFDDD
MYGKQILSEMAPYKQGKQMEEVKAEYGLTKIVKLASNENPFGYSPVLRDQMSSLVGQFELYPDGHAAELRTKVAKTLTVSDDQLVFGSGSDELVQIICRTFLYPGVNTVMATPTFPQYKHHSLVEGAEVREIPTVNGYHDLQGMLRSIDDQTKVIWLCSPNNPTGSLIPEEAFYSFMEQCPQDVLVVLDEAYYEFIEPKRQYNTIAAIKSYSNLLCLRTFSKAYGLAGLRVGYGIGAKNLINKLNVVRGPFNTSSFAQKAASIAIDDQDFIRKTNERNIAIKQDFQRFLDGIGWEYDDSETNFLFVKLPVSGNELFTYLLKRGFIVRPGEAIGCPTNTVRITIGNEHDMKQLQTILNDFSQ